ncbi:MAG: GNAT family N-acetyltransferase [Thermomicrobiales bacterium]
MQADQAEQPVYIVSREQGSASVIERLTPEWQALCSEGPCDEPFYQPSWVRAYLSEFDANARVTILTVRRDGALRAILPFAERPLGIGPVRIRWLRATANTHFPRFDVIHGAGDKAAVSDALWSFLKEWSGWDILQFHSAPLGGVAWELVEKASDDGYATRFHQPDASPYIDVTRFPNGVDEIITSLPSSLRSQNRRSLKRLRALGDVSFKVLGSRNSVREITDEIQAFYHLEASGWKGVAGSSILSDPRARAFYDRIIADASADHSLAICHLMCDEKKIATKLNLIWKQTMYELKSSYDEDYSKCSPGHLIKAYSVDFAVTHDISVLDNCGRADPHKLAWTECSRPFATCFIGGRSVKGRVAWATVFSIGPRVRKLLKNRPIPTFIRQLLD